MARPVEDEARIVEKRLHEIRRLANSGQRVAPSHGHDPAGESAGRPLHDVQVVREEVRGLSSRVVPEPAKVIETAVGVVGDEGRRPQPHVPVPRGQPLGGDRLPEAGRDVPGGRDADVAQLADAPVAEELDAPPVLLARPLLGAHLHHSPIVARRAEHPLPLAHDMVERLLHVDVLAGGAGEDGDGSVPVVGRRDHDRVHVPPVEQPPEVLVALGGASRGCHSLGQPSVADLTDAGHRHVGLGHEVEEMPLPDEADPDEAHAHPVVGAEHPSIGCRGEEPRARDRLQDLASAHREAPPPGRLDSIPVSRSESWISTRTGRHARITDAWLRGLCFSMGSR